MKIRIMLTAAFCLLLSVGVFAQASNFTGEWELDAGRSVMSERIRIESMTMKVTQTETGMTVERTVKRAERPEGAGNGGRGMGQGGMGGMRGGAGGGMGGDEGTATYKLDGKTVSMSAPGGGDHKVSAVLEKSGKIKIVQNREIETQMRTLSLKTTETWELIDNGQTLKIKRETETPRGSQTSELYFTKK